MDPHADDSSTDDDAASQTTEDDPRVPENTDANSAPLPQPPQPPAPAAVPTSIPASSNRENPHYELQHTMHGHESSIAAVKFSPDGTLLASCCE
jgi:COMPASS component SWD3